MTPTSGGVRNTRPRPTAVYRILAALNWILRPVGLLLVPRACSAKMLREHANVAEAHHPSRGGRLVVWMRTVADLMGPDRR